MTEVEWMLIILLALWAILGLLLAILTQVWFDWVGKIVRWFEGHLGVKEQTEKR